MMQTIFGVTGEDIYAATMEGSEEQQNNYDDENNHNKHQETNGSFESIPHYDIDWHESNCGGKALIVGKEVRFLSDF